MLSLGKRIDLLEKLGVYILSDSTDWQDIKERAVNANAWFTPEHITIAADNIARSFLDRTLLDEWVRQYTLPDDPKKIGIVMAGNIPLVGFHDFLCSFVCGHDSYIKLSSKDDVLLKHLIAKLTEWDQEVAEVVHIAEQLKHLDAYIATGSNNSARYFEQYFAKYPHIIRRNRTSVAVLDGTEATEELQALAKDVFLYFGLGCRNVTQICIPVGYDLNKLLQAFGTYDHYIHHNKYKNNYDYYLAIYLLNRVPYLTNESILLIENEVPFSAVSVLHYRYYKDKQGLINELNSSNDIQTIVGKDFTAFGSAQLPFLNDYADGIDTMKFLCSL